MRRRSFFFLASAILFVGCGKSFTELDAIYKDELSVLEDLYSERDVAFGELSCRFSEPGKKRWNEATQKYDADVEAWSKKHQKTMEEWASEHGHESTYVEDREEFERTLKKPVEPPIELRFHTPEEDEAYRREAKEISDRFTTLIEEQKQKIKQAKAKRDAAK